MVFILNNFVNSSYNKNIINLQNRKLIEYLIYTYLSNIYHCLFFFILEMFIFGYNKWCSELTLVSALWITSSMLRGPYTVLVININWLYRLILSKANILSVLLFFWPQLLYVLVKFCLSNNNGKYLF